MADAVGQRQSPLARVGSWANEHLGDVTSGLAWAAFVAQVPMSRGGGGAAARTIRSRIAAQLSRTTLGASSVNAARSGAASLKRAVRSLPSEGAVERGAIRGWGALREARMRLGETRVGRAAIKAQMPIYMGFGTVGGIYLGQDVTNFANGRGSVRDTALHALMVVPVGGELAARAAKLRALSVEARAARTSAHDLAAARSTTDHALRVADAANAPRSVIDAIGRSASELDGVAQSASSGASIAAARARFVGHGSAVPREVDQTLRVGIVRDQTSQVAQRIDDAARAARIVEVPADVRGSLAISSERTSAAHEKLQAGWRQASRSWDAARSAKAVEDAALKTSYVAFGGNNLDLAARAALQDQDTTATSAAVRAARIATMALLIRNERPMRAAAPSA